MIEYKVIHGNKTHITHFPVLDIVILGVSFGLAVSAALLGVDRNG